MNKKLISLILLVVFLPAIVAGVWYISVTSEKLTASNVSEIVFTPMSDSEPKRTFTSASDKEFFIDLKSGFQAIEEQEYDPDVYSLYQVDFLRIQGDLTYYLCLSADTKNCLAYDVHNNWYRIDKEIAKELLLNYDLNGVYKYSTVPNLIVQSDDNVVSLCPETNNWNYLVADGSYTNASFEQGSCANTDIYISSIDGLELLFQVEPDWYSAKIYDNDIIVYDGLLDDPSYFSMSNDCMLKAVVTAEWYEGTTSLYNGSATYAFDFHYDVEATYAINKTEVNSGEVIYLHIANADDESFTANSDFLEEKVSSVPHRIGQLLILPVPMDAKTGEYVIELSSEKNSFKIPVLVNAKDFGSIKVGLIKGEKYDEYNSALASFENEISSANSVILDECLWADGWWSPLQKFNNGKEQYWISAPSYGVEQIVDGVNIDERNFGVHYVKSVDTESLMVRAVAEGVIAFSGETSAYGNTVVIEHGQGVKSVYGHLEDVTLSVGDRVKSGDYFALVSPKSFSISSNELFFAVYVNGVFVNPFNFIAEPKSTDISEKSEQLEFFINR